jgi:PleD family two-component response regulator
MPERIPADAVFESKLTFLRELEAKVSVGVTGLVPEDTMERLSKRADVALCEAKAAGRNQVKISI